MRPKPELDPELMSCPKPKQGRAARRRIGWLLTVTTLGVLGGLVAQAERQRSGPRIVGLRNRVIPLQQSGPGALRALPQLPPADRSIIVAPRDIDEAMIKVARQGIDEAMIVNPSAMQGSLAPVTVWPLPAPGVPGGVQPGPWQPSPAVPQPHR